MGWHGAFVLRLESDGAGMYLVQFAPLHTIMTSVATHVVLGVATCIRVHAIAKVARPITEQAFIEPIQSAPVEARIVERADHTRPAGMAAIAVVEGDMIIPSARFLPCDLHEVDASRRFLNADTGRQIVEGIA